MYGEEHLEEQRRSAEVVMGDQDLGTCLVDRDEKRM